MMAFARKLTTGLLFVTLAMFGISGVASANLDIVTEPVTAESSHRGEVTLTNGGLESTVKYGPSENGMSNKLTLAPGQVVTINLDADIIYWQAGTADGTTSTVHAQKTDQFDWDSLILWICLVLICGFVGGSLIFFLFDGDVW